MQKVEGSSPFIRSFESCGRNPPTNKDQCKDGGWQSFNNPFFNNQGGCVSYVVNHPAVGAETASN